MSIRKIIITSVAAAIGVLGVAAGPAGSADALPRREPHTGAGVSIHWYPNSYGWYGYPSDGGVPIQMTEDPSEVYDYGQTNADGTITTWEE